MHLTNAVIHESLRHASFTFFGVPRLATEDLSVGGYTVPAGSTVFANLFWIMNDPAYWSEPDKFDPDRFINPETGEFEPSERMVQFGIGQRACPGKVLAEQVINSMSKG